MGKDGEYGTICDDYWSVANGNVVCRILGLGSAISAPVQSFFGQGNGEILLDDVECDGSESSLFSCKHLDYTKQSQQTLDCISSEAAGVVCSGFLPIFFLRNST